MPAPFPEGVPGTGTHGRHSNPSLLEPSATEVTRHQPDLQTCHLQLSHSEAATGSWPPCVSDSHTPAPGTPWGLLSNHQVLSWHAASHTPPTPQTTTPRRGGCHELAARAPDSPDAGMGLKLGSFWLWHAFIPQIFIGGLLRAKLCSRPWR